LAADREHAEVSADASRNALGEPEMVQINEWGAAEVKMRSKST
jgi:hypothetical protein